MVLCVCMGFPSSSVGKESACNAGNPGSIPGSGRSPGEGNGDPLQYSCLGNSMDRGHGGLQSMGLQRVRHNCVTFTFHIYSFFLFFFFHSVRTCLSLSIISSSFIIYFQWWHFHSFQLSSYGLVLFLIVPRSFF